MIITLIIIIIIIIIMIIMTNIIRIIIMIMIRKNGGSPLGHLFLSSSNLKILSWTLYSI